ncbi:MAG: aldehyde dehydrogenase [Phycisphaerae bacterium]
MTQVDDRVVREMVERVLSHIQSGWGDRPSPRTGQSAPPPVGALGTAGGFGAAGAVGWSPVSGAAGRLGQFKDVSQAVAAAKAAQRGLSRLSLEARREICRAIKDVLRQHAAELGEMEYEETRIGHRPHKTEKVLSVANNTLGVDDIGTECFSGDHGITLEEHAPWGVIGIVTPVTHSLPTLADNAINIIAAGNALVCNPHPGGKRVAAHGARLMNEAVQRLKGIDNLICVITEPTLESAKELFAHPDVRLLGITGGPGVVAAALRSGKRAICAGPGNPPVVVDASADLDNAARCIIEGASYDNNLLCLSEKECFVEAAVYEPFMAAMERAGACRLTARQMDELAAMCILPAKDGGHGAANREFVGAEPHVIAAKIGLRVSADCRLLFGPTGADHPFVQAEQMMPVLPVVKCDSFEQAVECAKQAEHGFGHTAVIHSRLVDHMTFMGKAMNTTLYVKNGPSLAGDGWGGEGYGGYSIACSTGEGICTPRTYTRLRRCAMIDNLRIL